MASPATHKDSSQSLWLLSHSCDPCSSVVRGSEEHLSLILGAAELGLSGWAALDRPLFLP